MPAMPFSPPTHTRDFHAKSRSRTGRSGPDDWIGGRRWKPKPELVRRTFVRDRRYFLGSHAACRFDEFPGCPAASGDAGWFATGREVASASGERYQLARQPLLNREGQRYKRGIRPGRGFFHGGRNRALGLHSGTAAADQRELGSSRDCRHGGWPAVSGTAPYTGLVAPSTTDFSRGGGSFGKSGAVGQRRGHGESRGHSGRTRSGRQRS